MLESLEFTTLITVLNIKTGSLITTRTVNNNYTSITICKVNNNYNSKYEDMYC